MRKVLLLILVFVCSVVLGQEEVVKKGLKVVTRNAKILKAHYLWEYNEPSDWANIHYAKSGEALLLVNDSADRYIAFDCIVQSSGQYSVDVYGGVRADSLISTQTLNTTVDFNYQLPSGKGKSYGLNGYDTYIVRIYPTLKTKQITNITARSHPSSAWSNYGILLANINIPTLSSIQLSYSTGICRNIRYVNLYKCINITSLGGAFSGCSNLYAITLPKTLSNLTVLTQAFSNCISLHHVNLPRELNNVTKMGSNGFPQQWACFANCSSLVYVTMPQSMSKVTDMYAVFSGCPNLEYMYLPTYMPKVTSMGYMFNGCTKLKYIKMPMILNSLLSLNSTFYGCTSLEKVDMPITFNAVTNMSSTFAYCSNIKSVVLPDTLNYLTTLTAAFDFCTLLERVSMPTKMNQIQSIGQNPSYVFRNCINLDSLSFPDSLPKANTLQAFQGCTNLVYAKLPKYAPLITSMDNLFNGCSSIKSIRLPDTLNLVTTIRDDFQALSVDSLFLPKSATNLVTFSESSLSQVDTISTCTFGTSMVLYYMIIRDLKTFKQPTLRVSKLTLRGASLATASALHTIDIDWANSTYGGTTPQIDIRWNSLSATTLDAIFTALPVVVGKTINVNGNPGSATCTPSIATVKGWTVII